MLNALFSLDVKTLIAVLFFGTLTSVALIATYLFSGNKEKGNKMPFRYILAKICQAGAYFCFLSRGIAPDIFSVNIGNTLLFLGFFMEAMAILTIIHEDGRRLTLTMVSVFLLAVLAFNITEAVYPDASIRVTSASLCVFCILIIPIFRLLFSHNISRFKRIVGVFYLGFLLLLMPRAAYALFFSIDIHTNFFIQALTFLSLLLLLIYSLPAYLLLMKEKTDQAIATMATTDFLTGLPNRYSFLAAAAQVFENYKTYGKPLTILFFDIDHFKKINDTYGHAFGDDVLKYLGEATTHCLRSCDLSCRYGGEEFVLLLPDVSTDNAFKIGQRLMGAIANAVFSKNPGFSFTVSIGMAGGVPSDQDTLEDFVKNADTALYTAKNTGRNKIVEYKQP